MGTPISSVLGLAIALFVVAFGPTVVGQEPANQVPCSDPRGCPDLVVDPDTMAPAKHTKNFKEQSCNVQEGMIPAGERTVMYFTFTTPNFGSGDLIVGSPDAHFEWGECHGHWHFKDYADYRVWTTQGYAEWDALRNANPDLMASEVLAANPQLLDDFAFGGKRGFCIIDVVLYEPSAPKYLLCDFQGISVGWADEYYDGLDGQFVDVTGLAPGQYVLESEVNAEWLYKEESYANNRASVLITI